MTKFKTGDVVMVRQTLDAAPAPPVATAASSPTMTQIDDRKALINQLVSYLPDQLTNETLARWLRAAEMNLRFSHNVEGEIKIEIVKPSS